MNTRKVIILTYSVPTKHDLQKTGYSELKTKGYSVSIWSLFLLFNQSPITYKPIMGEDVQYINSYKQLNELLLTHRTESIFLDCIVGFSFDNFIFHHLLRLLRKNNIVLFFVYDTSLPVTQLYKNKSPLLAKIILLYKKIKEKKIKGVLSSFVRCIFRLFIRYTDYYPKHKIIFSTESEALGNFLDAYKFPADSVIPIHCSDYDLCLDYRKSNRNLNSYSNICVFLDEAATHHPDNSLCGLETADEDYYYKTMTVLFDWIEEKTRMKVVIAAHPRSNYSEQDQCFGSRSIIYGKTFELVRESKLVLAHSSTSINFAVIFRKPVVFLQIRGVYKTFIEIFASHLGSNILDLNGDVWKDYDINNSLRINDDHYKKYFHSFIKSKNLGDNRIWDIIEPYIVNELEIMSQQKSLSGMK